jgi:phosphoribosylformylglycinamidine synthase
MEHLVLQGDSCFSASEAASLKERVSRISPEISNIKGNWVYYIHLGRPDIETETLLKRLLPNIQKNHNARKSSNPFLQTYHIVPRNLSPWSSKATSIAGVCGLGQTVMRIERGRKIILEFKTTAEEGAAGAVRNLLYDRMTETWSTEEPNLKKMFSEENPRSLEVVPIGQLKTYSKANGLAMDESEIEYLTESYHNLGRDPYDIE